MIDSGAHWNSVMFIGIPTDKRNLEKDRKPTTQFGKIA
jgi:hypothetical protein